MWAGRWLELNSKLKSFRLCIWDLCTGLKSVCRPLCDMILLDKKRYGTFLIVVPSDFKWVWYWWGCASLSRHVLRERTCWLCWWLRRVWRLLWHHWELEKLQDLPTTACKFGCQTIHEAYLCSFAVGRNTQYVQYPVKVTCSTCQLPGS